MSFEEEFPSLKDRKLTINDEYFKVTYSDGKKEFVFREREIEQCCIDKQRFNYAIKKLPWINHQGEAHIKINDLLKELGLNDGY